MGNQLCCKCDRPLSDDYWLTLFMEDGTQKNIRNGLPPQLGRHVAVYCDVKCPTKKQRAGRPLGVLANRRIRNPSREKSDVVYHGDKEFRMSDITVQRKGEGFMMIFPKKL
jgi:hypothetical protein